MGPYVAKCIVYISAHVRYIRVFKHGYNKRLSYPINLKILVPLCVDRHLNLSLSSWAVVPYSAESVVGPSIAVFSVQVCTLMSDASACLNFDITIPLSCTYVYSLMHARLHCAPALWLRVCHPRGGMKRHIRRSHTGMNQQEDRCMTTLWIKTVGYAGCGSSRRAKSYI
jgi:hypothetical protein